MRVISGKARSIKLKTIDGDATRPTTDRIKETLFNMINNRIYDCNFLDLFAGSGGIGIEALSRGAKKSVFVDMSRQCESCIKNNLNTTHLGDNSHVYCMNVLSAIKRIEAEGSFDIIFMDPPYNNLLEKDVLVELSNSTLVNSETLIIVEASLDTDFSYLSEMNYSIIKEKIYKTNKHVFIEKV